MAVIVAMSLWLDEPHALIGRLPPSKFAELLSRLMEEISAGEAREAAPKYASLEPPSKGTVRLFLEILVRLEVHDADTSLFSPKLALLGIDKDIVDAETQYRFNLQNNETKQCQFCLEQSLVNSNRCRMCGSDFKTPPQILPCVAFTVENEFIRNVIVHLACREWIETGRCSETTIKALNRNEIDLNELMRLAEQQRNCDPDSLFPLASWPRVLADHNVSPNEYNLRLIDSQTRLLRRHYRYAEAEVLTRYLITTAKTELMRRLRLRALADIFSATGRYLEAANTILEVGVLESFIFKDKKTAERRHCEQLASLYIKQGILGEASKYCTQLIESAPLEEHEQYFTMLVELYLQMNEPDSVEKLLAELEKVAIRAILTCRDGITGKRHD